MKRTLVITEEFGLWKVEGSNGAHGSGGNVEIAVRNFFISSGADLVLLDELEIRGGARPEEIFELCLPKRDQPDVPRSTVR